MQNCEVFHQVAAEPEFTQALVRQLARRKNGSPMLNLGSMAIGLKMGSKGVTAKDEEVADKVLKLFAAWSSWYQGSRSSTVHFGRVAAKLRAEGHVLPTDRRGRRET